MGQNIKRILEVVHGRRESTYCVRSMQSKDGEE